MAPIKFESEYVSNAVKEIFEVELWGRGEIGSGGGGVGGGGGGGGGGGASAVEQ